ncbi:hypothetical protein [Arenimonas caeni]|uniref:hypothetical protein n=1 Tax=Arenimonas caeni TaxID=2058085 RepID=UPI0013B04C7D|nr:hypothetical protein [Arenimonas caeni]MDY0021397.1 hypothetical protein [Arenimonas caeni]
MATEPGRASPVARLVDAIDLHVIGIAAAPLVLAAILPLAWVPWLVAAVPLGRVYTRAMDLRASGRPIALHLLANGLVLTLATALGFLLSPA